MTRIAKTTSSRMPTAVLLWVSLVNAMLAPTSLAQQPAPRSVPDARRSRPATVQRPVLIEFKGEINSQLSLFFNRRMTTAKESGADLLIIEIDSPGGLKYESLQMARRLRDCDWAYTVVLVNNQAISGGSLVSLGADEIQIAPNAKFGDSGEIAFDVQQWSWRLIEPKVESYLSRDARDLAESKGRPPALAESMIDKDVLVYVRETESPAGDQDLETDLAFTTVRADAQLKPDPPWQMVPETGPERFLTLSGQRAVELGMAQGFASTRAQIAEEFGFELDELTVMAPTVTDATVYYLNSWWATLLLIVVGLIAIYFELSAPGIGVGGLLAGLCAVLFFWSHFLGGTAGVLEVLLFLAGITFLAAEVFVIPGFGVAGIAGLLLLFCSVILAGQDFVIPQNGRQMNVTLNSMAVAAISGVVFLVSAVLITQRLGHFPVLNKIILSAEDDAQPESGQDGKDVSFPSHQVGVGDWGIADSALRPAGRGKFNGRAVDVVSDGSYVEAGRQIRVIDVAGSIIKVTEVENETVSGEENDREKQPGE